MLYVDITVLILLDLELRGGDGYQLIEIPGRDRTLFYSLSRHVLRLRLCFATPNRQNPPFEVSHRSIVPNTPK